MAVIWADAWIGGNAYHFKTGDQRISLHGRLFWDKTRADLAGAGMRAGARRTWIVLHSF